MTLNDEDRLWVKLRHMHMKDAIDLIMADFKEFASKNASFQGCVGFVSDHLSSIDGFPLQRRPYQHGYHARHDGRHEQISG